MTTRTQKHQTVAMEAIIAAFKAARDAAHPVATVCMRVKHASDEGETVGEPTFEIVPCTQARPAYDYKVEHLWDVPIFATMSDADLRRYARQWVAQQFPEYAFPYGVDVLLDEESERSRQIDAFLREVRQVQDKYAMHIEGGSTGLFLAFGNDGTQTHAHLYIHVAEDGTWSVDV